MMLRQEIEEFVPFDEVEKKEKEHFLRFIDTFSDVLTRENEFGHFSASCFVVNKARDKVLVVYHNIYKGWVYPGGHADGCEDLLSVALWEVEEETGLKAKVLDSSIFAISSCPIVGHVKRGCYVSSHIHFDVIYLVEADDSLLLCYREEESAGVKWISLDELDYENIVFFTIPVFQRIIQKLNMVSTTS